MSDFETLLEGMVPGASRQVILPVDEPSLPASLGLVDPSLLARGGWGWVFRATDPILERTVAVKISRVDRPSPIRSSRNAP